MLRPGYIEENKDISNMSGFKTKASARYFFELTDAKDVDKILELKKFTEKQVLKIIFIGSGTNCLFAFDRFDGLMVKNSMRGFEVNNDNKLKVMSGEQVSKLSIELKEKLSVSALVPWIGLPGTFGGAVVGNAGCFSLEAKDMFVSSEILDLETGKIFTADPGFMKFSYRTSSLNGNPRYFLLSSVFDLKNPVSEERQEHIRKFRSSKQPKGFSCGSVFRNPEGFFTGKLIDEAGLKGKRIGGAYVSKEHGNFILSDSNASHKDITDLVDLIKETVFRNFGVRLQEEIRIIRN